MIEINAERCTACELCVSDCPANCIGLKENTAVLERPSFCLKCGHCIAICPNGAISDTDYNATEHLALNPSDYAVDPVHLSNLYKFRRSIRQYKNQAIESEKLSCILEAGRYSPTSSNRQSLRFITIEKDLPNITALALKAMNDLADKMDADHPFYQLRGLWHNMYNLYVTEHRDLLFNQAPVVLMIIDTQKPAGDIVDGGLAASRMEILAQTLGLGCCYNGFFKSAAMSSTELKKTLAIGDEELIIATMTLGYPSVEYQRTVVRNPINVTYY